jgi:GcrA cell cycle regulator
LLRIGLKRGHKPRTAKPKIRPMPKRRPALLAACARPVAKMVPRKTVARQPKEFTKRQLYAMLAEAVRNTG